MDFGKYILYIGKLFVVDLLGVRYNLLVAKIVGTFGKLGKCSA